MELEQVQGQQVEQVQAVGLEQGQANQVDLGLQAYLAQEPAQCETVARSSFFDQHTQCNFPVHAIPKDMHATLDNPTFYFDLFKCTQLDRNQHGKIILHQHGTQ